MPNGVADIEMLLGLERVRTGVHAVTNAALRAFWCRQGVAEVQERILLLFQACIDDLNEITQYPGAPEGRCTDEQIEMDGICVKRPD